MLSVISPSPQRKENGAVPAKGDTLIQPLSSVGQREFKESRSIRILPKTTEMQLELAPQLFLATKHISPPSTLPQSIVIISVPSPD